MEHRVVSTVLGSSCDRSGSEEQQGEVGGFWVCHALWRLIWVKRLSQRQQWPGESWEIICVTTITTLKTVLLYFDLYTRKLFWAPLDSLIKSIPATCERHFHQNKEKLPQLLSTECWMVAGCCSSWRTAQSVADPLHRCGKSITCLSYQEWCKSPPDCLEGKQATVCALFGALEWSWCSNSKM